MTTTATRSYTGINAATKPRERGVFLPLIVVRATAGTGIMFGESAIALSSSMTHQRPPQPWVAYLPRETESDVPEIDAKIFWSVAPQEQQTEPETWDGIYALPQKRQLVFSQQVSFRIGDLPQRRPHITPVMLTMEEDDAGSDEAE